jgi:signal transduction histidine kinase
MAAGQDPHDARLTEVGAVEPEGEARIVGVLPGGHLWDQGVRRGDRVLALDGRAVTAADIGEWSGESVTVAAPAGQPRTFHIARLLEGRDPLPLLALSPWFILLGTLIFLRARELGVARAAYALFASAAFGLGLVPAAHAESPPGVILDFIAVCAFAASFLLFFLSFPVARGSPRLRALLLLPAVAAGVLRALGLALPPAYQLAAFLQTALLPGYLAAGAGLMLVSWAASRDPAARRGLSIVAAATTLSVAPFVALYLLPTLVGRPPLAPAERAALGLAILPAGFAYAILRHEVLRVRLLQRWVVHAALWIGLLLAYSPVVYAQHRLLDGLPEPARTLTMALILTLTIGLTFTRLRERLRRALDRLIFKDAYDLRATTRRLSRDLSRAATLEELGQSLPGSLRRLMGLDFALLLLRGPRGAVVAGEAGGRDPALTPQILAAAERVREAPETLPLGGGHPPILYVPLRAHGSLVGWLCLGPKTSGEAYRPEDRELLGALAGQVAAVARNAQLLSLLEAKVEELSALNSRLQRAQEEERARLSADLHDEPLQTAIQLQRRLAEGGEADGEAAGRLALGHALVAQLRAVCAGARPSALDDLGLPAALDALALDLGERGGVPVLVDVDPELSGARLSSERQMALYRAAQEAINNALRHARPATVRVSLRHAGDAARLEVADDGAGFETPPNYAALVSEGHLGLAGLRRRLERLGGRLRVASSPGGGTTVRVDMPIASAGEEGP